MLVKFKWNILLGTTKGRIKIYTDKNNINNNKVKATSQKPRKRPPLLWFAYSKTLKCYIYWLQRETNRSLGCYTGKNSYLNSFSDFPFQQEKQASCARHYWSAHTPPFHVKIHFSSQKRFFSHLGPWPPELVSTMLLTYHATWKQCRVFQNCSEFLWIINNYSTKWR